jgi:hypothetical protein
MVGKWGDERTGTPCVHAGQPARIDVSLEDRRCAVFLFEAKELH